MILYFFLLIFSFLFSLFFGKYFLFFLKNMNVYQNNRLCNHKDNFNKNYTPTMGGIIILFPFITIIFFFLFFMSFFSKILFCFFLLNMFIGLLDDYIKCFIKNSNGLSILEKYFLQTIVNFLFVYFLLFKMNLNVNYLYYINNKIFYLFFLYFIIVFSSNAINITDGLDGLVIFPLILNCILLLIMSIISSSPILSFVFGIKYINYSKDLIIINIVLLGSLFSFFIFNFYPAKVFLGDVGSLSIGFLIISMFILLYKEFYFFLSGFIFFLEIISVIIQVIYFKIFKKRFFYIAPIHHHYEIKGYSEIEIVLFFWILSLICFIFSLLFFLKL